MSAEECGRRGKFVKQPPDQVWYPEHIIQQVGHTTSSVPVETLKTTHLTLARTCRTSSSHFWNIDSGTQPSLSWCRTRDEVFPRSVVHMCFSSFMSSRVPWNAAFPIDSGWIAVFKHAKYQRRCIARLSLERGCGFSSA
jgi:hypothetical protein